MLLKSSLACCSVSFHEKLVCGISSLFAVALKLTMHTATISRGCKFVSRAVNLSGFYCYCPAHVACTLYAVVLCQLTQEISGMLQVRGKDFRHEKTKKKRGSYKGGIIDNNVNSFKFESDDE